MQTERTKGRKKEDRPKKKGGGAERERERERETGRGGKKYLLSVVRTSFHMKGPQKPFTPV